MRSSGAILPLMKLFLDDYISFYDSRICKNNEKLSLTKIITVFKMIRNFKCMGVGPGYALFATYKIIYIRANYIL